MDSIPELVRRAQAGDLDAYAELVRRFQGTAFGQAFTVLGDSHQAEDAVQDAFVQAHRQLASLQAPEAFARWFHRVVSSACNRIMRRRRVPVCPIEEAHGIRHAGAGPAERLERSERDRTVHAAVQALPDSLRMVTALHYIGGLPQRAVAEYLGLSGTAVKKRLFNARGKLREQLMDMAQDIAQERPEAEQVSARVIAELVSRPQPMLIRDHPIRMVVDDIVSALPECEVIESREVEEKSIYPSIRDAYSAGYAGGYHLDEGSILRTQTSGATLRAIEGREPPIRLLTAGRVYRTDTEDDQHLKVFHQLDGICVSADASPDELRATLGRLIAAVLGASEVRYREHDFGWVDIGMEVTAGVNDRWHEVGGCGMLKPAMLREAGHDPGHVQGYAYGFGLERLAQLRLGLDSIRDLWRPPYLRG